MRDERALSAVPGWIWALLLVAAAAQAGWQAARQPGQPAAAALPPAPSAAALELAAFGERPLAARLVMLYLQAFDVRGLDYPRLIGVAWRHPRARPAQRISAVRRRARLRRGARCRAQPHRPRFRLRALLRAIPNRRWPWLAHAALLAKHRLNDLPLARRYARRSSATRPPRDVPLWARQMEIFILEDMNELEAAKIMLGGLLERGRASTTPPRRASSSSA